MQEHQRRGADRTADVADEDGSPIGELDLGAGGQPGPVGRRRREGEVGVGAFEWLAQIDSTLRTVTVSAPFGASYVTESPAEAPWSAPPSGLDGLMTSAPSTTSSTLPTT